MTFEEILQQTVDILQNRGRISYRALKRQFDLDDDYLDDLKEELLYAYSQVVDDGRGIAWTGEPAVISPAASVPITSQASGGEPGVYTPQHLLEKILISHAALEGERKQVTVFFCDLANSTSLAEQLGAESMHTVLNQIFALALSVVHHYEGTINQFLGDGFMALFGAPIAHTDEDFDRMRAYFSDEDIIDIVALIGYFGFLNRWNDTMATDLEELPQAVGETHLRGSGWTSGKHAAR